MHRILLLEDDTSLAEGLCYFLKKNSYETDAAKTVKAARELLAKKQYDLLLLDVTLPDGLGFEICESVRNQRNRVPVIFLTASDEEMNVIRGLDSGGDDYIVKPFRIRELLARVRRILSTKNKYVENDNIISIGQATIHTDEAKVYVNDRIIELTALEYRLLLIFAGNKGSLLSRQQILDKIWDADGNFVEDNTLTVYVKRLREKLGEAVNIETVRGMGYRVD